jgi:hypothetical protein
VKEKMSWIPGSSQDSTRHGTLGGNIKTGLLRTVAPLFVFKWCGSKETELLGVLRIISMKR